MEFANAFMGHVGFEELKKHCRQGDDFIKEVLSILNERAAAELTYAKALKRMSQRLSKSCSNLVCSPLSTLWKSICIEMDVDSESHRKLSLAITDECVKPYMSSIDSQSKSRKSMELTVESASKVMSDRLLEHSKLKKRHHQFSKEKEALNAQLEGARPKTKNDESKLAQKRTKNDVLLTRNDEDYYESLLDLQRKQSEWEFANKTFCVNVQTLERNKLDSSCRIAMLYSSLISNVSHQLALSCEQVKKNTTNLDPDGEIRIFVQNRKIAKYKSEQQLCDYYGENFDNRIKSQRRASGLSKPLEKFLGDLQKERAHYDGMKRLMDAQSDRATEQEKVEMKQKLTGISSMIVFLDVNRSKLQKAIATVNGTNVDTHPLAGSIEQHYDKQGIMHSILRLPSETDEPAEEIAMKNSGTFQSYPIQRSLSEKPRSKDDIGLGKSALPKSMSMNRGGTLTAKQLQLLQCHTMNLRKQAPQPPVQNFLENGHSSRCVAKYRYDQRESDELTLQEGDVITIHEKCDEDWWKGEINGRVGIFPATYVDII